MDTPVQFFAYWYYALPNYLLAALMYSLLARFLLSLVIGPGSSNYIFRFLVRITDPVVWSVAFVTPQAVPPPLLLLFAIVWILIARFVLFLVLANAGLLPSIG